MFLKFRKFDRKSPALESLLNKITGLQINVTSELVPVCKTKTIVALSQPSKLILVVSKGLNIVFNF